MIFMVFGAVEALENLMRKRESLRVEDFQSNVFFIEELVVQVRTVVVNRWGHCASERWGGGV